ncbi:hypothetical protein PanWU01x14_291080, partial [Parasponia andersonii]
YQRVLRVEKQALRSSNGIFFSGNNSNNSQIRASKDNTSNQESPLNTTNPIRATTTGIKCFQRGEMSHRQANYKKSGKRALFCELGEVKDDKEIGKELTFNDGAAQEEYVEGDTKSLLVV